MKAVWIVTLWLLVGGVAAAANPLLSRALPAQAESEAVTLPEPARLEPDWWRYFQVEADKLELRVAATRTRLQALIDELPDAAGAAARPFVEGIGTNLEALARASRQPDPTLPSPRTHADAYTVAQLLDIVKTLDEQYTRVHAELVDAAALEGTIKPAQKRVDTLMAAYLGLAANDPERVLHGLEIMAGRSAVALVQEKLRLVKGSLQAHQARIEQLENEQVVAAERLAAGPADLERLNAETGEARSILKLAQERTGKERARALGLTADDPQARIRAAYRQQKVVNAAVLEGIAEARLIRLLAESEVTTLLADPLSDTRPVRQRLQEWSKRLDAIRRQSAVWREQSERERGRASEALADGGAAGAAALFDIGKLLQQDRLDLAQQTLVALQSLDTALAQAELLARLLAERVAAREGGLREWINRAGQMLAALQGSAAEWINQSLFKLGDTPVTAFGLLRVAVILFLAWWISHWFRRALSRLGERREGIDHAALYTVGRLSHYVIVTVGLMLGLASIGVDFTNFALLASAMAIGMGFGLQSIVSNFVSGLIILFERSLKVGDFVELASGIEGEVREISVRSTRINTNDNVDIVVPNSEFINNEVINWTLQENYRRIHVPFRVAYGTDIKRVTDVVLEAADQVPHTLKARNAGVWVVDFAESSLDFELVVWIKPEAVKRPGAVHADYKKAIALALYEHDIEVPIPQRDLRLRSGFKDMLAQDSTGKDEGEGGGSTGQRALGG